jgi:DNA-binding transcriptional MerR regulator
MTEPEMSTSSEVAAHLEISSSTLRRWTVEFADFLSEDATASDGRARRYTERDADLLSTVKSLLSEGNTYYQVGRILESQQPATDAEGRRALTVPESSGAALSFLTETLHTVSDSQQLLLGSQQATRDLLGVLLQDNFSLKEENAKLRDRMLNLERELTEFRRHNAKHHRRVESRLKTLEVSPAPGSDGASDPAPDAQPTKPGMTTISLPEEPKGCLAALLGMTE